jgi:hypothetical protein
MAVPSYTEYGTCSSDQMSYALFFSCCKEESSFRGTSLRISRSPILITCHCVHENVESASEVGATDSVAPTWVSAMPTFACF